MSAARFVPPARVVGVAALAAAAVLAIAGCTSNPVAARVTPGASASPAAGASSAPSAGASAPALVATPLAVPCDTLAPATALSSISAGMTSVAKPSAPASSDAAVIAAQNGTLCQWSNASGLSMTLAVGQYDDASLTTLKNSLATSSNLVPTYDGEGYFQLHGKTGTAEAFSGAYWVVAISDTFSEPGTAEPLVDAAIAALKQRG